MFLLTDGRVMVQDQRVGNGSSGDWWLLTPDAKGNYADGTWLPAASMPAGYAPLYAGDAVLPDGPVTITADSSVSATFEAVLPKQGCVVPKVTRKGLAAAKRAIKRAHRRVGKIRKAYSKKVRKGRVIAQKPRPHAKLAVGSRIRLTVSKGPKPRH